MKLISQNEKIYTKEELENVSELCSILQKVRTRLISEGYSIDKLREQIIDKENGIL